ncbi:hypothetical protein ACMD2_03561 [Ananas comosus]|uniref:Uncharacterized protein n=1 Tax=Ananas comosus TaxID=4615 RepID=A0A199UVB0_ANACO|nr:hypothetical protein ACMD2_03561 [Ananas comosus]
MRVHRKGLLFLLLLLFLLCVVVVVDGLGAQSFESLRGDLRDRDQRVELLLGVLLVVPPPRDPHAQAPRHAPDPAAPYIKWLTDCIANIVSLQYHFPNGIASI